MKGFTFIELLVAIALIGILSAIAIPTYLSFPSRVRESEALAMVRAGIAAQQAYYLEFQDFASTWQLLDIGKGTTNNYTYIVEPLEAPETREAAAVIANPVKPEDKAFLGAIATVISKKAIRFTSAICESSTPIRRIEKLLQIRTRKLKCKGEV